LFHEFSLKTVTVIFPHKKDHGKISSMPMVNHAGITFALCLHKRHDNQLNGSPGWRQNKMREIVKEKFMQKSLHFGLNLYFMNLN